MTKSDLQAAREKTRAARGGQRATPAPTTARRRRATVTTPDNVCRWLGEPLDLLPGCGCQNPPRLYECRCDQVVADRTVLRAQQPHEKTMSLHGVTSCARCLFRQLPAPNVTPAPCQWAVAVTAAKRPGHNPLRRCLTTLAQAGWPDPLVFADGADCEVPAGVRTIRRQQRAGALPNFYTACSELLVAEPTADAYLIVQDDTAFCRQIRHYLARNPWPGTPALIKLFTDTKIKPDNKPAEWHGWLEIPHQLQMRGAQAYIFPRAMLERFVASPRTLQQRRGTYRQDNGIDNVVAMWARDEHLPQLCHYPSLCQHTGQHNSTLGHDMPEAVSYPGDNFNALQMAPRPPVVTAVMITGHDPRRRPLALVAIEAFRRQSYEYRELLIVNEGEPLLSELDQQEGSAPIREIRVDRGQSLGALRNFAIDHARGQLVLQWDDDDFSTSDRMARQVAAWRPGNAVILRRQIRVDLTSGQTLHYDGGERGIEGTILHETKTAARYPDQPKAEDTEFVKHWRDSKKLIVLDAEPTLYVRTYHGANTWDRKHIMDRKPAALGWDDAMLVDSVRLLYPLHPLDRWAILLPRIHGWAAPAFCNLLVHLARFQTERGLRGPVLEIGVHHGRSLFGMAAAAGDAGDRVLAVDPFVGACSHELAPGETWHDTIRPADADPFNNHDRRRAVFDGHTSAIFGGVPDFLTVWEKDSGTLAPGDFLDWSDGDKFRLIHVDGDHRYATELHDLENAAAILAEGGILCVDDILNERYPAVGPCVWENWRRWGLIPVAFFTTRLICTNNQHAATSLLNFIGRQKGRMKTTKIGEFDVHVYSTSYQK